MSTTINWATERLEQRRADGELEVAYAFEAIARYDSLRDRLRRHVPHLIDELERAGRLAPRGRWESVRASSTLLDDGRREVKVWGKRAGQKYGACRHVDEADPYAYGHALRRIVHAIEKAGGLE